MGERHKEPNYTPGQAMTNPLPPERWTFGPSGSGMVLIGDGGALCASDDDEAELFIVEHNTSIDTLTQRNKELEAIEEAARECMSKLGPNGYVPSFGQTLSDKLKNALASTTPPDKPAFTEEDELTVLRNFYRQVAKAAGDLEGLPDGHAFFVVWSDRDGFEVDVDGGFITAGMIRRANPSQIGGG